MIRSSTARILCVALGLSPLAACNCGAPPPPAGEGEGEGAAGEGEGAAGEGEGAAGEGEGAAGEGEGEGEGGAGLSTTSASSNLKLPLDAALSPDGATIYYVAQVDNADPDHLGENAHSLFSVPSDGSAAPTDIADDFVFPLGIAVSLDGNHVFVADAGFQEQDDDVSEGTLFDVDLTAGNSVTEITSVYGYRVRGVETVDDGTGNQAILFSGTDPGDGVRGLFRTDGASVVDAVSKDALFTDPSEIAAVTIDQIFVTDTSASESGKGAVIEVATAGGTTTTTALATDLNVGYPAGIATDVAGSTVFVSGLDGNEGSLVIAVDVASGAVTTQATADTTASGEAGGLHRAKNVDTFAWCGVANVFRVTF